MRLLLKEDRLAIAQTFWSSPDATYDLITRLATERAPVDSCYVCLYDSPHQTLRFVYCIDGGVTRRLGFSPLGSGPTSTAIISQERVFTGRIPRSASEAPRPLGLSDQSSETLVHEPMISDLALSGSEIQGVISFQSYTKDAFDPDFLCWTEDVASLLANLLAVQGLKDQTDTTIDRVRAKANALAHAVTKIEYRSRELQEQALQGMDAPLAHEVFMLARRLGNIPINDLIQEAAENSPSAPGGQMRELLSERERQVADLVYLPNKTIAHQLCLSEHTVAFHLKSIYKKLRVLSKAEAAAVLNQSIA